MADLITLRDMLGTKSVSDMTDDELREHLRNIRVSRRTVKANKWGEAKEKASPKQPKAAKKLDLAAAANNLSADELEALIKKLGG